VTGRGVADVGGRARAVERFLQDKGGGATPRELAAMFLRQRAWSDAELSGAIRELLDARLAQEAADDTIYILSRPPL
jgi:hypothetical protein